MEDLIFVEPGDQGPAGGKLRVGAVPWVELMGSRAVASLPSSVPSFLPQSLGFLHIKTQQAPLYSAGDPGSCFPSRSQDLCSPGAGKRWLEPRDRGAAPFLGTSNISPAFPTWLWADPWKLKLSSLRSTWGMLVGVVQTPLQLHHLQLGSLCSRCSIQQGPHQLIPERQVASGWFVQPSWDTPAPACTFPC